MTPTIRHYARPKPTRLEMMGIRFAFGDDDEDGADDNAEDTEDESAEEVEDDSSEEVEDDNVDDTDSLQAQITALVTLNAQLQADLKSAQDANHILIMSMANSDTDDDVDDAPSDDLDDESSEDDDLDKVLSH